MATCSVQYSKRGSRDGNIQEVSDCRTNLLNIFTDTHTMDMLWEKFQWILPLYMKLINFQSKASVVCSVTTAIFIDFCLKKLNVFTQPIGKKKWISEFRRAKQMTRNWNVNIVSVLMEHMSGRTGFISSYPLLVTAACTNTGSKMKGSRPRAADRCPFVPRHS